MAAPRTDVAALPLQVAKRVFAYAVDSRWGRRTYTTEFLPRKCTSARGHSSELEALYRELEHQARGDRVRDLRICMGKFGWDNQFMLAKGLMSIDAIDALHIDWERLFASCSKILRLDLACVPLNTMHVAQILEAASSHCLELQALVLPTNQCQCAEDDLLRYTMDTLYHTLEKWFALGTNDGLLQLTVPKRVHHSTPNLQELNDAFLNTVANFCPNIQYLDGWKASYYDDSNLFCDEMWLCTLSAWQQFCASCTHIREFNWIVAPFDEDFLTTFAAHRKPHLKKMTMVCGDEVYDDKVPGGGKRTRGCTSTRGAASAVNGMFGVSRRFQQCVNDEFLRKVAECCPELKKLIIYEMQSVRLQSPLKNVTDEGLLAISRMPRLEHIALKQTQCSVSGILALVQNAPNPRQKRRVILKIGSTTRPQVRFFDVLLEFMELFGAQSPESLENHRFELKLIVSHNVANSIENLHSTRAKLVTAVNQVLAQHPTVAVSFQKKFGAFEGIPEDIRKIDSVVFLSPRTMPIDETGDFDTQWITDSR
ncbi:hypothetical protein FI667_g4477, partial [Globisporangium splendens]